MSITVNTAASRKELVLLNTIKDELGITGSGQDGLIASYIKRASAMVESYTGRRFARETVTETLAGSGTPRLLLTRRPIVSITYVKLDGSTQSSTSYAIDDADGGILWKNEGWSPSHITSSFITTRPSGYNQRDWEIKYVAGYITPGSTEGESNLPADIEFATAEIVKAWYLARTDNPNIKSQRVGDSSETKFTETGMFGMPPVAQTVLSRWRDVDIAI